MKTLLMIGLILVAATGAAAQDPGDMIGAWSWQSTDLGNGTVETPASTGHTVQLQFSAGDAYLEFIDGALVAECTWGFGYAWVDYFGNLVHVPIVTTESGQVWEPLTVLAGVSMDLRRGDGAIETYVYTGAVPADEVSWGSLKTLYHD